MKEYSILSLETLKYLAENKGLFFKYNPSKCEFYFNDRLVKTLRNKQDHIRIAMSKFIENFNYLKVNKKE